MNVLFNLPLLKMFTDMCTTNRDTYFCDIFEKQDYLFSDFTFLISAVVVVRKIYDFYFTTRVKSSHNI
jgi:hypothetical protein